MQALEFTANPSNVQSPDLLLQSPGFDGRFAVWIEVQ